MSCSEPTEEKLVQLLIKQALNTPSRNGCGGMRSRVRGVDLVSKNIWNAIF